MSTEKHIRIPKEIAEQGGDAIWAYLDEMQRQGKYDGPVVVTEHDLLESKVEDMKKDFERLDPKEKNYEVLRAASVLEGFLIFKQLEDGGYSDLTERLNLFLPSGKERLSILRNAANMNFSPDSQTRNPGCLGIIGTIFRRR